MKFWVISVSVVCGSRVLVWVELGRAVVICVFSPFPSHLKNKRRKNQRFKRKKKIEWHPLVLKKKDREKGKMKVRDVKTPRVFQKKSIERMQ